MPRIIFLAGAALALSAGAALSADMVQIKTEAEFRKVIVGKKLDFKIADQIFHADGKISGTYKGKEMAGTWNWVGETYCRTLGLVGRNAPYDCRIIAVKGSKVTITRKAGKGEPYNGTIMDK